MYVRQPRPESLFILPAILAIIAAATFLYSQTDAFAYDEGDHLIAAQSIFRGKRPYLDFVFPQTPLNAYWNALCFRLFGDTWRVAHAMAALLTSAAVVLLADYVFQRFPVRTWRLAAVVTAAVLFGLNYKVIEFGPLQGYGMCLFLTVAAFRCAVAAVERRSLPLIAASGFFAAAAAGSSLLTAPVAVVLLVYILVRNAAGSRWRGAAAFVSAGLVALSPLLWLLVQSPRVVWFNIVEYMLLYRRIEWPGATQHDLGEVTTWLGSPQALLTGILAVVGLLFIRFRSEWDPRVKSDLYLCARLAAALGVHISTAHPTFIRYYILALPFIAVLAVAGMYYVVTRLYRPERPLWPVLALALIFTGAL